MESDARYIKKLEGVLSDYTEEELEVRKHKVNIKDEKMARLVCYHPSTEQMVNYRMHTTPPRWYSNQGGSRKDGQGQECVGGVERVE